MKLTELFLATLCSAMLSISCSKTEQTSPSGSGGMVTNPSAQIYFSGFPDISFNMASGEVDTDYEVSTMVHATFRMDQSSGADILLVELNDDDPNAFPFADGSGFAVNGTLINAKFQIIQNMDTMTADLGTINITEFMRTSISSDVITISGSVNTQINGTAVTGSFLNVLLDCGECE